MRWYTLFALVLLVEAGGAQETLSLRQAIQLALKQNKSKAASEALVDAGNYRVRQAKTGLLPKLSYSESLTRSNNPVFVFGSLLTQHQFAQANFDVHALNRPGFLDNFQSNVTLEQTILDGGQSRKTIRSAELTHEMNAEDDRRVRMQVTFAVVRAYFDAVLSRQALAAAAEAVKSAESDLEHAEQVRRTGMSTDVDVLSIRVHLARIREQQIRRDADLEIASSSLNDALGISMDVRPELTTPLAPTRLSSVPAQAVGNFEDRAIRFRSEQRRAALAEQLASVQVELARSAYWPRIAALGVFETDRQQFLNRGGVNWLGQISLSWNLFNGGADRAKVAEANSLLLHARAERERQASSLRLEVRRAWADWKAANQQIEVAEGSVAEAQESLRITQNRYDAGMSTVTDLLRSEAALLDAGTLYAAALHDQRLAAVLFDAATGSLSIDSPSVTE